MTRWVPLLLLLPAAAFAQTAAVASYFPLDPGDEWVYRIDSRAATADYQTWRIDRVETRAGVKWSVMQIIGPGSTFAESWFRADEQGRVYQPNGDSETLFFDPSATYGPAILKVTTRGTYSGPGGSFSDVVFYQNTSAALLFETGVLARGVGLVTSTQTMQTGSSGGFTQGRRLVEATLAGGAAIRSTSPSLELGLESLELNVSGRKVTNCAVPCYFVACGVAPGYDPLDTYRPCAQARARVAGWPGETPPHLSLRLSGSDGATVWQTALGENAARGVVYLQVPLYAVRNQPFAPGRYRLQLTVDDGSAASSLAFEIR
jgi:hypothetical protein